jgi:hypothetical protein
VIFLKNILQTTIGEFEKFIEFIENEKPVLSARQGVLGKKDSFKLNKILHYKKNVSEPNYTQAQYPVIDLMFSLALAGGLYVRAHDERDKAALVKTPLKDNFQDLNLCEKYVYLLQTYWTKYNFDGKSDHWRHIISFYNILASVANADEGQRIVKDDRSYTSMLYSEGAAFFHHLNFFGLGELELIDGAKGRYEDSIRAFVPNEFGIYISTFLLSQALLTWNTESLCYIISDMDEKTEPQKNENPFEVFKNIFPKEDVKRTLVAETNFDRTGVYTFKVSLSRNLWRKISISHKHSLYDLHLAIQKAFNFDNDHLYAFYVGGNQRTGKPIYCADAESDGVTAEEMSIADLGLYKGQKLLYLFDFGDSWKFDVTLLEIDKNSPLPLKPVIVEKKGKSPEQYSSWY